MVIKKKKVFAIMTTSAVFSAYLKAVKDYIQPLMVHVALLVPVLMNKELVEKNGMIIGIIYFFIYLLSARASKMASIVADKNNITISNTTLMVGLALGLLCGVFFYYEQWLLALLAFVGIYLVENVRKPILTGFIADQVPNEILTSVISAQSLLKTLITVTIALSFGLIADTFGIGTSFIVVTGILMIFTKITKIIKIIKL